MSGLIGFDRLALAKAEFLEMEKMGIVRKSKSPWSSALGSGSGSGSG